MIKTIGIRREDKNKWERRVPLSPSDVLELHDNFGIKTLVQPSGIRIFKDEEYEKAGAEINEDLDAADVIFAIKEIPSNLLEHGKTYLFFSHTIKGQPYNMKMLERLMELECNLIDYERIVGEKDNRLITFSRHAGIAGLIETLHAFGQKMKLRGYVTPFEEVKQAYQYESLEEAKSHVRSLGKRIFRDGLPKKMAPLTVGFLGYGNVSKGAQEIFDLLPYKTLRPDQLESSFADIRADNHFLYKIVFKEEHIVKPESGPFNLQDYYNHPERFESIFTKYIPHLKILVNGVYWTEKYPRFVTRENLKESALLNGNSGIEVIGDITCDINGSIEITRESTMPDKPCYTYYAEDEKFVDGIRENGITVMAVDNLPCEFSRDASCSFSGELKGFVNDIVAADFREDYKDINLPHEIKKATILYNGHLTEEYKYMNQFLVPYPIKTKEL